jgi:hypothetical protein
VFLSEQNNVGIRRAQVRAKKDLNRKAKKGREVREAKQKSEGSSLRPLRLFFVSFVVKGFLVKPRT